MAKFHSKITQSFSKIGTSVGLGVGVFAGRHHLITVGIGILGSIIGSQIIFANTEKLLDDVKVNNTDATAILKQHFSEEYFEALNPLQTNYNLYERDNIGKLLDSIIGAWHKITKFAGIKCEKNDSMLYPNKVISTKTIVFDWFRDKDPLSFILDVAPAALLTVSAYHKDSEYNYVSATVDNAIIYVSRPILNYIAFSCDRYHDIEELELSYHKDEIKDLELTKLIPDEVIDSMYRCSI